VDLEVHRSAGGHVYAVDFARLFPPDPSDADGTISDALTKLLRPELVRWWARSRRQPLSSDAFTGFHWHGAAEHQARVQAAAAYRDDSIIPAIAAFLDRHCSAPASAQPPAAGVGLAAAATASAWSRPALGATSSASFAPRLERSDTLGWRGSSGSDSAHGGAPALMRLDSPSDSAPRGGHTGDEDDDLLRTLTEGSDAGTSRGVREVFSGGRWADLGETATGDSHAEGPDWVSPAKPSPSLAGSASSEPAVRGPPGAAAAATAEDTSDEEDDDESMDQAFGMAAAASQPPPVARAPSFARQSTGDTVNSLTGSASPTQLPPDLTAGVPCGGFFAPWAAAGERRWGLSCGCTACDDGTTALGHGHASVRPAGLDAALDEEAAAEACLACGLRADSAPASCFLPGDDEPPAGGIAPGAGLARGDSGAVPAPVGARPSYASVLADPTAASAARTAGAASLLPLPVPLDLRLELGIPTLAAEGQAPEAEGRAAPAGPPREPYDPDSLCRLLHSQGVNLRGMGRVWARCTCDVPRVRLATEMLARAFRARLRARWRGLQPKQDDGFGVRGDHEPWRIEALSAFNDIAGTGARAPLAWVLLLRTAAAKFPGLMEGGFVGPALARVIEMPAAAVASQLQCPLTGALPGEAELGMRERAPRPRELEAADSRYMYSADAQAPFLAKSVSSRQRPQGQPPAEEWLPQLRMLRERLPPGRFLLRAAQLCGIRLSDDVRSTLRRRPARLLSSTMPLTDHDVEDLEPRTKSTPMRHYAEGTLQFMRALQQVEETQLDDVVRQAEDQRMRDDDTRSAAEAAARAAGREYAPSTSVARVAGGTGKGARGRAVPAPRPAEADKSARARARGLPSARSPGRGKQGDGAAEVAFPPASLGAMSPSLGRMALAAASSFEQALSIGGDDGATLCNYGYLLEAVLHAPRLAVAVYLHARGAAPEHARIRYYLSLASGRAARRLKTIPSGAKSHRARWLQLQEAYGLVRAVQLDPGMSNARKDLANFHRHRFPRRSSQLPEAYAVSAELFAGVLRRDPTHSMSWLNSAQCLQRAMSLCLGAPAGGALAAASRHTGPGGGSNGRQRKPKDWRSAMGGGGAPASAASQDGDDSASVASSGATSSTAPGSDSGAVTPDAMLRRIIASIRSQLRLPVPDVPAARGPIGRAACVDLSSPGVGTHRLALACIARSVLSATASRNFPMTCHELLRHATNKTTYSGKKAPQNIPAGTMPSKEECDEVAWAVACQVAQRVAELTTHAGPGRSVGSQMHFKPPEGLALGHGGGAMVAAASTPAPGPKGSRGRGPGGGARPASPARSRGFQGPRIGSAEGTAVDILAQAQAALQGGQPSKLLQVRHIADAAEVIWPPLARETTLLRCDVMARSGEQGLDKAKKDLLARVRACRLPRALSGLDEVRSRLHTACKDGSLARWAAVDAARLARELPGMPAQPARQGGAWGSGAPRVAGGASRDPAAMALVVRADGTVHMAGDESRPAGAACPLWLASLAESVRAAPQRDPEAPRELRSRLHRLSHLLSCCAAVAAARLRIADAFSTTWSPVQARAAIGDAGVGDTTSSSLQRLVYYSVAAWWIGGSTAARQLESVMAILHIDARPLIEGTPRRVRS